MSNIKVGETLVTLKKGDITAESTDAIINLQVVGKAVFDAAGPNIKEEYERLAKLPNDGYVVTSAGNMECCDIIHLIDKQSPNIVCSVRKALKACDENNMINVSLPAMGTEATLDADISIRYMMKGIEDHLRDPSVKTEICYIVIVVHEQDIYEIYQRFFQNYETNYPHFSAFGKMIELIKGDITHQVVDCIVNLTNSTLNQSCGVSGAILRAAGDTVKEECKKIGVLQGDGVAITSGGKLGSKKIMHIIGPTSVHAYQPSIERILGECHKNGFTSVALPAIGTGIAGEDVEASIKAILNCILDFLSENKIPSLELIFITVIQENIYKKYLEVFQAKSTEIQALQREEQKVSGKSHGVLFHYPVTWTNIGKSEFQEIIVEKTSQEFKDVKDKFFETILESKYRITQIKRIQNVPLWQSFTVKKQIVNRKNPGQKNIRLLYHGTDYDATSNINRDGFNRVYCYSSENGSHNGKGISFAVDSRYSCNNKFSCPDFHDKKHMYQAAVITGRYYYGNQSCKEAPHIDGDPKKGRYDSLVDDVENPKVFVIFHDDVAYPEYLITFKEL